jgi:hypothetical protein
MCSRLEGRYTLSVDDREGDCGDIPEDTSLVVTDLRPGYRLEASWLRGCVLRAATPGSCQYEARCEAIVARAPKPLLMRVTRNSSGFYGPAEVGTSPPACKLEVDTSYE